VALQDTPHQNFIKTKFTPQKSIFTQSDKWCTISKLASNFQKNWKNLWNQWWIPTPQNDLQQKKLFNYFLTSKFLHFKVSMNINLIPLKTETFFNNVSKLQSSKCWAKKNCWKKLPKHLPTMMRIKTESSLLKSLQVKSAEQTQVDIFKIQIWIETRWLVWLSLQSKWLILMRFLTRLTMRHSKCLIKTMMEL